MHNLLMQLLSCMPHVSSIPSVQGEKALPEQVTVVVGGQAMTVSEVHVRAPGAGGHRLSAPLGACRPASSHTQPK